MEVTERRSRVMASDLHVIVTGAPAEALDEACAYLDHLEHRWSRFLADSDVSRINQAGGRRVTVAPETLTLLASMVDAWYLTAGRYDPTILPALLAAGYSASREDPSRRTVLPELGPRRGSLDDVELDDASGQVRLPAGLTVDPGGIGKGLAADLAVRRLLEQGAAGALVDVGGDLSAGGRAPSAAGWVVEIEQIEPSAGALCRLAVSGGGVATSSTRSRRWTQGGEVRHHVIDPATGAPSATDLLAVTVVAPTGWEAEAHAGAALLGGRGDVLGYLDRHGLSGLAVAADGSVAVSEDLAGALALTGVAS